MVRLGLGRQLGDDAGVGLLAAEQERPHQAGQALDGLGVLTGLHGARVPCAERLERAEQPGVVQSSRAHSSERLFSTGVPVSATRAGDGIVRSALAVAEKGFLMCCASSATTMPQVW